MEHMLGENTYLYCMDAYEAALEYDEHGFPLKAIKEYEEAISYFPSMICFMKA